MSDIKVTGGVDFKAYLADFAANFVAAGRGAFSDGLGGDEYVLWSGSDTTIPVDDDAQAFIIESGDAGDLAYDFTTHTVGGTIDAIEFGLGVTENAGDYSTNASIRIEGLGLESTGGAGIVNQLITDLMAGNTDVLYDVIKGGDIEFAGSTGDDVFMSFAGDDELKGGKGNDSLGGGKGADSLIGGKGDDVLTGGKGADLFDFAGKKFGHDVITDFGKGKDVIELDSTVFSSFKDVKAAAVQDGDDVVITIGGKASITLEDFTLSDLHKSDFIFD